MPSKIGSHRKPPNAGNGRPRGAVNRTTALLKEAILLAAEEVGTLLGKVLPMHVTADSEVPLVPIINLSIGEAKEGDRV